MTFAPTASLEQRVKDFQRLNKHGGMVGIRRLVRDLWKALQLARKTTEVCGTCAHPITAHTGRPDGDNDACAQCPCLRMVRVVTVR